MMSTNGLKSLAITLLARQGFITQKTIADAFGVSVRTSMIG